jgi:lipopolysaccharide export system protein LptA
MSLNIKSLTIIINLTCLFFSVDALALQSDRKQPINVEADRANINKKTGASTYSGHVIVQQGSIRISADKLTVYTRNGKFEKMLAQGKPVEFKQRVEKGNKDISAIAERMTFHASKNIIIFEQGARLSQGANTFSSNRIIYDQDKDTVDAGKKSGGDRVTITIQPEDDTSAPANGSKK